MQIAAFLFCENDIRDISHLFHYKADELHGIRS